MTRTLHSSATTCLDIWLLGLELLERVDATRDTELCSPDNSCLHSVNYFRQQSLASSCTVSKDWLKFNLLAFGDKFRDPG